MISQIDIFCDSCDSCDSSLGSRENVLPSTDILQSCKPLLRRLLFFIFCHFLIFYCYLDFSFLLYVHINIIFLSTFLSSFLLLLPLFIFLLLFYYYFYLSFFSFSSNLSDSISLSTSKKYQAFFAWKISYYAIWCMSLILRSYISWMITFKGTLM